MTFEKDNTRLVNRFLPPDGTITRSEYHRLGLPLPVPPLSNRKAHWVICGACGVPFLPHNLARRPRFCSSVCRRWYHYGPGNKTRKAMAAAG